MAWDVLLFASYTLVLFVDLLSNIMLQIWYMHCVTLKITNVASDLWSVIYQNEMFSLLYHNIHLYELLITNNEHANYSDRAD
jgi:hypothetical protein